MEFINKIQEKIKTILGYLFLIIGSLSLFLERNPPDVLINLPVTNNYITPILFLALGAIFIAVQDKGYRGGIFTYLGLLMGFFALFGLSMEIESYLNTNTFQSHGLISLFISVFLLVLGHKQHNTKFKKTPNKKINADQKPHA